MKKRGQTTIIAVLLILVVLFLFIVLTGDILGDMFGNGAQDALNEGHSVTAIAVLLLPIAGFVGIVFVFLRMLGGGG